MNNLNIMYFNHNNLNNKIIIVIIILILQLLVFKVIQKWYKKWIGEKVPLIKISNFGNKFVSPGWQSCWIALFSK